MSVEAEQVTEILTTLREARNELALREDRRERKVHKADEKLARGESKLRAWKRDQADAESEKAARKDIKAAAKAIRDAQEFLAEYMHDRGYIDDDTAKMCNDISDAAFVLERGENLNGESPFRTACEEEAEGTVVIEGDMEADEPGESEEAEVTEETVEAEGTEVIGESMEAAEPGETEEAGETEATVETVEAEETGEPGETVEAEETEVIGEPVETVEAEETEEVREDKKDDE